MMTRQETLKSILLELSGLKTEMEAAWKAAQKRGDENSMDRCAARSRAMGLAIDVVVRHMG